MPNFELSFECEGSRDLPPKRNRRGRDVYQLSTIYNKWNQDTKDGPEHFEIEYWEKKNGMYLRCMHLGSEVRTRYSNEVKEWERKYKEDWAVAYGSSGNVFKKPMNNVQKKDPQNEGVKTFRNEGNFAVNEQSEVATKTLQPLVDPSSIIQDNLKRRDTSIPSGQLNFDMAKPQDQSSRSRTKMPLPKVPDFQSNHANAPKHKSSMPVSTPYTSNVLSSLPNSRSNLMLPPQVPIFKSKIPLVTYGRTKEGFSKPKSRDSQAQYDRRGTDILPPPQVSSARSKESMIPKYNGSMPPPEVLISRSNNTKLPVYNPASQSVNSVPNSRAKRARPNKLLPSRSIYRSEVLDDDIEDSNQVDRNSNEQRLNSSRPSKTQPGLLVPNISEDEMDIDSDPITKVDKMDIDINPPTEIDQTHHGGSEDEMDIDHDPSLKTFEALGDELNDIIQDRNVDDYQDGMGAHIEAIYQTSQTDLMRVFTNTTDGEFEDEGIPAIGEQLDLELQISSPGKLFHEYSDKLIHAHSEGLAKLIEVTLNLKGLPCDRWVSKRTDTNGSAYIHFLNALMIMLAGIDKRILKHLVEGNLPSVERNPDNYEFSSKLKNMRAVLTGETKLTHRPYIYIQYLVDKKGISPTPKDIGEILDHVELYLEGFNIKENQASNDCALEIDTAFHTTKHGYNTVQAGYRRYASSERNPRSLTWKKTILQWVETTRDRLRYSEKDEPLSRPLVEVGYATALSRLDEHKNHTGSNYIMNLIEAICKAYFREKWSIKQYVLFKIAHHTHAMFGEILCTRMAQAYTTHGGGFCHHAAGISLGAVHKMDDLYWRRVQRDLLNERHGFWDNMREASLQLRETTRACNQAIQEREDSEKAVKESRTKLAIDIATNWDERFNSMGTRARDMGNRLGEILQRIERQREEKRRVMNEFLTTMGPLRSLIELANMANEEEDGYMIE
ncbi:uncharacterized protein EAF02_005038 [Botrytis sinoallii]|uniref:uncharacterized protein n=1 Tax=Botrytis sinoallii TaxID=1463999 RepID=UPI0018FFD875|nr:uncharacterized protein EAF02_005038 [Botrytis sinoallii]KAF7884702.1 hypothetical protein EAF02_005038 [Botrytis sinoallii]